MKRLIGVFYFGIKTFLYQILNKNIVIGRAVRFIRGSKVKIKNASVLIGNSVAFDSNTYICSVDGGKLDIGDNVYFNKNCIVVCREKISIGNKCLFGPNVCVYDHDHIFSENGIQEGFRSESITIGEGCWIGAGCIILRGTQIGRNCVIGAGLVIKGVIPDNSIIKRNKDSYTLEEIRRK